MGLTVGICACTSLLIILSVLLFPKISLGRYRISSYWLVALCGALLLLLFRCLSPAELFRGLTAQTAVNPIKILVLFLSMTVQSVLLDEAGFFCRLASWVALRAGGSQKKLFVLLYVTVSVLTVFTSNDIVILTFTPFICYFAAETGIKPLPYLIAEFVAANTWSMILIIGNPTNLYLAGSLGCSFMDYLSVMLLPAFLGGLASFAVLWLLFRRQLGEPMRLKRTEALPADKPLMLCGLIHLSGCVIFLVVSSFLRMEMWLVSLLFAVSLLLSSLVICLVRGHGLYRLIRSILRSPFEMVPFVLSMFALVLSLERCGATAAMADFLRHFSPVWGYGIASCLASNLVNNIPMSVLFSSMIALVEVGQTGALYAAVIGSNVGAFLTPIGALAGMMWSGMLKDHDVKFSFDRFVLYGVTVAVPTLLLSLLGLSLIL